MESKKVDTILLWAVICRGLIGIGMAYFISIQNAPYINRVLLNLLVIFVFIKMGFDYQYERRD